MTTEPTPYATGRCPVCSFTYTSEDSNDAARAIIDHIEHEHERPALDGITREAFNARLGAALKLPEPPTVIRPTKPADV